MPGFESKEGVMGWLQLKSAGSRGSEAFFSSVYMVYKVKMSALEFYHRITEWYELEGSLGIIQFQPLCHGQG